MKKIIFLCITLMILLMGVNTQTKASVKDDINTEITKKLIGKEEVKKIYYYDYDKNGTKEAFVLTGIMTENAYEDGGNNLWFAYEKDGRICANIIKKDVLNNCKILKLKSVILFCAAEYCTTSMPMDVYKVVGEQAQYIFQGDMINYAGVNSFTSVHSTYDAMIDNGITIGHTWKPYWFYYSKGKIVQYKAKKISQKKFKKKYKNASKILKKYKKLGKVQGILYRSNKLIHINYRKANTYSHVTLKVKGKKLVKSSYDGGTYLKVMPEFTYGH